MDRRKIDVVLSALFIIAALIILTNDNLVEGGVETELGSLFLPRIVAVFMIIFAATMGIQAILQLRKQTQPEGSQAIPMDGFLGVNIYIGIFIAYWFAVPYVGFLAATPVVMLSIAVLLGGRNWIPIIAMSVLTPLLIFYGCSYFLRVFLPTWSLS